MASRPGAIHRQIAELLRQHPEGLTSGQIRAKLNLAPDEQAQLDRRRRDLRKWFILAGGVTWGHQTAPVQAWKPG
jgi:hypothetical protein